MTDIITLQGYGTRKYVVDLKSRTATEEKIMRRTGKRYTAKVTNTLRLQKLLKRAEAGRGVWITDPADGVLRQATYDPQG